MVRFSVQHFFVSRVLGPLDVGDKFTGTNKRDDQPRLWGVTSHLEIARATIRQPTSLFMQLRF